jgi:hypothetical protein
VKQPNFNLLVKPFVLERTEDEVRVAVVEMKTKQVLVKFCWSNLTTKIKNEVKTSFTVFCGQK